MEKLLNFWYFIAYLCKKYIFNYFLHLKTGREIYYICFFQKEDYVSFNKPNYFICLPNGIFFQKTLTWSPDCGSPKFEHIVYRETHFRKEKKNTLK